MGSIRLGPTSCIHVVCRSVRAQSIRGVVWVLQTLCAFGGGKGVILSGPDEECKHRKGAFQEMEGWGAHKLGGERRKRLVLSHEIAS